jgi:acyl-CoA ligase (AMP-forming) (exosortase A-associated)
MAINNYLLHHLIAKPSDVSKNRIALKHEDKELTYFDLSKKVVKLAKYLNTILPTSQNRISIFLEKRFEFVSSCFASSCAGQIFIPINPILKPDQVLHILNDSKSSVFITTLERIKTIDKALIDLDFLDKIILLDVTPDEIKKLSSVKKIISLQEALEQTSLEDETIEASLLCTSTAIDTDAVSIFYTSGSTGKPKGVVLSHRNMVFGAKNVSSYLENNSEDILLAALPLSFDAGFSQLTTGFYVGAKIVLLNYILPNDILKLVVKEKITGLTAVPPLWIQIANLKWPDFVTDHLRYFANTGGKMPLEILKKLRTHFPKSKPFLMYGLTESFRSTYLPPEEIDQRPNSIGKAIPNAQILILKPDGSPCKAKEPGELVHRGALVGLGYWNDPEKTAERYKLLPTKACSRPLEVMLPEYVVFSGDLVEKDDDGFIYFIGRNDEMMKTSGYRVSPMEVEEVIYNTGVAEEVASFSIPDPKLEQIIIAVVKPFSHESLSNSDLNEKILNYCKDKMPSYMVPSQVEFTNANLPRNQNGKIDRKSIALAFINRNKNGN